MTMIPDTNYQVRDNTILAPDGQTISKEDFLKKVESKEISLTENSLKMLGSTLGPDLEKSLRVSSGLPSSPSELSGKLGRTEQDMMDIYALLGEIAKMSNEQRKSMSEVRHSQSEMQIDSMKQSAQKELDSAMVRMVSGIVGGCFSIGAGVVSGFGAIRSLDGLSKSLDRSGVQNIVGKDAFKALPSEVRDQTVLVTREMSMQIGDSQSKILEGAGRIVTSGLEYGSAKLEKDSKDLDIQGRKMDEMGNQTRDLVDSIKEMNAKVRDVMQAIQSSESQTNSKINSI